MVFFAFSVAAIAHGSTASECEEEQEEEEVITLWA